MTEIIPEEGFCGTAGCLAGHVVMAHGFRLHNFDDQRWVDHPDGRRLRIYGTLWGSDGSASIAEYARDSLGLDNDEADRLFAAENDLDDLKEIVEDLCAQPGRAAESKDHLRWAMDRVLAANAAGLWDQGSWVRPPR